LALELRLDRQLAYVAIVHPLDDEDAADDPSFPLRQKSGLVLSLAAQAFRRELMGGRWRVDNTVHIGEGAINQRKHFFPAVETGGQPLDQDGRRAKHADYARL
jgi:hypothetical protein